jgi:acetoin utilization protein AcuB
MLMPTVGRYMTREPRSVRPEDSLASVYAVMTRHQIRHVPVMDNDDLIGIIHESDIWVVLAVPAANLAVIPARRVAHAPTCVWKETPLDEVARQMADKKCDAVVVRGGGGIEGIFTSSDALRALGDVLERAA